MVEFRFVGGNRAIVGDALSTIRDNIVRISQRMRLEPTQLEAISNNLRVSGPSEVKLENDELYVMMCVVAERSQPQCAAGYSAREGRH